MMAPAPSSDPLADGNETPPELPPALPPMPAFTDAGEPSLSVIQRLGSTCLARLRVLEPDILADRDPSFLHQYRVTLRNTRSLCKLLRDVLDEPTTLRLKNDLGELARAGNQLRDLDVHLVDHGTAAQEVPAACSEGVQQLIAHLTSQRHEAQRVFAERLRAPAHAVRLDDLDQLVHGLPGAGAGPEAVTPISVLARRAAWRAWRTVRRRARRIVADTDDAEIHDLRIRVKRLRYLLDSFGALIAPPSEIGRLVERIKDLQAALGSYNDTINQLRLMLDLAQAPGLPTPALLATGVMSGILTCRRRDQRAALDKLLAHATGKAMRRAYERCLRPVEDA